MRLSSLTYTSLFSAFILPVIGIEFDATPALAQKVRRMPDMALYPRSNSINASLGIQETGFMTGILPVGTGIRTSSNTATNTTRFSSFVTSGLSSLMSSTTALVSSSSFLSPSSSSVLGIGVLPFPTTSDSSASGTSVVPVAFSGTWSTVPSASSIAFGWVDIPTQTISDSEATSEAVLVGGLYLALQSNRQWITDPKLKSQYLTNVERTKDETSALLNDLKVKPPPAPPGCSNTKRKRNAISEKEVRALLRNRGLLGGIGNAIKSAAGDIGKLLSCATDVINDLDDAVKDPDPDIDEIENLTDSLADIANNLKDNDDNKSSTTAGSKSATSNTSKSASSITSGSACSITHNPSSVMPSSSPPANSTVPISSSSFTSTLTGPTSTSTVICNPESGVTFSLTDATVQIDAYCRDFVGETVDPFSATNSVTVNGDSTNTTIALQAMFRDDAPECQFVSEATISTNCATYFLEAVNDCDTTTTVDKHGGSSYQGCIQYKISGIVGAPFQNLAATTTSTTAPVSTTSSPPAYATGVCCFHVDEWEDCAVESDDLFANVTVVDNNKNIIIQTQADISIDNGNNTSIQGPLPNPLYITGEHEHDYIQFYYGNLGWTSRDKTGPATCDDGGWNPRDGPVCLGYETYEDALNQMDCCFPC